MQKFQRLRAVLVGALRTPQPCKHVDLLPVRKLRETLASPIEVSIYMCLGLILTIKRLNIFNVRVQWGLQI